LGLIVAGLSAAVGLGIGVIGIVTMSRQSESETIAVDRYRDSRIRLPSVYPPGHSGSFSAVPNRHAIRLPLLSLSF